MFVIHINELDESSETKFLSLQMKLELEAEEIMKGNETWLKEKKAWLWVLRGTQST